MLPWSVTHITILILTSGRVSENQGAGEKEGLQDHPPNFPQHQMLSHRCHLSPWQAFLQLSQTSWLPARPDLAPGTPAPLRRSHQKFCRDFCPQPKKEDLPGPPPAPPSAPESLKSPSVCVHSCLLHAQTPSESICLHPLYSLSKG